MIDKLLEMLGGLGGGGSNLSPEFQRQLANIPGFEGLTDPNVINGQGDITPAAMRLSGPGAAPVASSPSGGASASPPLPSGTAQSSPGGGIQDLLTTIWTGRSASAQNEQASAIRRQYFDALVKRGLDEESAFLASRDPKIATSLLFGSGKGSKPASIQEYEYAKAQWESNPANAGQPFMSYGEFDTRSKRAGATQVSVGTGEGSKKFEEEMSKFSVRELEGLVKASTAAQQQLASLGDMRTALASYNKGSLFGSGTFGESELAARRVGMALGIGDADTLASGELANSIGKKLALLVRNPDSGMGMPGAMSDADRNFLEASQPGISKSPLGNEQMIAAAERVLQRQVLMAQEARKWISEKRTMEGFDQYWTNYMKSNPMFTGLQVIPPSQDSGGGQGPSSGRNAPARRKFNPATGALE